MATTNTRTQREGQSSMPHEPLKEFFRAQADFIGAIGTMNEQWYDRMQSEGKLASEFALNLAATRSIPDAVTAWQEWTTRWLGLVAADGMHFLDTTQKLVEASRQLQSKTWFSGPIAGST